jgi:hypothetical protein
MLTMTDAKYEKKKAQLIMNVKDTTSVDDSWNKNINNFDINQESSGMFSIHLYLILILCICHRQHFHILNFFSVIFFN